MSEHTGPVSIIDHEVLSEDFLPLPPAQLVRVWGEGPYLVLGALLAICDGGETFASCAKLAEIAGVGQRTAERALADDGPLVRGGWLKNAGRQHPKRGETAALVKRRTATRRLTAKASTALGSSYNSLPRRVVGVLAARGEPMSFAEKLVLAEFAGHARKVDALAPSGRDFEPKVSAPAIARRTGLSIRSVRSARGSLVSRGILTAAYHLNAYWTVSPAELPSTAMEILNGPQPQVTTARTTCKGRATEAVRPLQQRRSGECIGGGRPPATEAGAMNEGFECRSLNEGIECSGVRLPPDTHNGDAGKGKNSQWETPAERKSAIKAGNVMASTTGSLSERCRFSAMRLEEVTQQELNKLDAATASAPASHRRQQSYDASPEGQEQRRQELIASLVAFDAQVAPAWSSGQSPIESHPRY